MARTKWLSAVPLLLGPALWMSSTAAGEAGQIEVVVVTAEKHAEFAGDVGIALHVLDGEQLRETGADDVSAIASQIPNVEYTSSANLPTYSIRGIGLNEFQTNFDSPVGVQVDEVYQSKNFMMSMPTYDVDRVEVLKGPQGTLFGRNTIGGSVNYYLHEPDAETGAQISVNAGSYGRVNAEGFFNTPLTGSVSFRASGFLSEASDGPYLNLFDGKAVDVPRQTEERVQLKWSPEDATTIRLSLYGGQDHSSLVPYKSPGIYNTGFSPQPICAAVLDGTTNRVPDAAGDCTKFGNLTGDPAFEREPSSPRVINAIEPNVAHNSTYGGLLRVTHETGLGTFTSLTALEYFYRQQNQNPDDTTTITAETYSRDLLDQFSQELRLNGERGAWNYVAGVYFEDDLQRQKENANLIDNPLHLLPPTFPRLAEELDQSTTSAALYLHNQYKLTDQLSITGGLRYTVDMLSIDAHTFLGGPTMDLNGDVPVVIPVSSLKRNQSYYNLSFLAGVAYKPTALQILYFNVTTGYRSGGVSVPYGSPITQFAPEEITAYEAGWKATLLGRTLELDTAAFRYDYRNLQVNVSDPSVSVLVPVTENVKAALSQGIEQEVLWMPDSHWTAELGVGYLDAHYTSNDKIIDTYGPGGGAANPVSLLGKELVNAPPWSVNAQLRYEHSLNASWSLVALASVRWTDTRSLRPPGQPFDLGTAYTLLGARVGVRAADGDWDVAVWGKNILNQTYLTYVDNVSFFKLDMYGEPAEFGVSITRRF